MQIAPFDFAPDYIKNVVKDYAPSASPSIYAFFRNYKNEGIKYPSLRDRRYEVERMFAGFGKDEDQVICVSLTGKELYEFGFDAVGAQFSSDYYVMWK